MYNIRKDPNVLSTSHKYSAYRVDVKKIKNSPMKVQSSSPLIFMPLRLAATSSTHLNLGLQISL